MNAQQLQELSQDEGTRLLVYDDATGKPILPGTTVVGHPTIGTGRALDVHGITPAEAAELFANDVRAVETAMTGLTWFAELDPVRQGVLVNLAFNIGVRGVQSFMVLISDIAHAEHDLRGAMLAAVQKDFDAAAGELTRSKWATQVQPSRRDRLVAQLRTGELAQLTV